MPNPDQALRAGMYASVEIEVPAGGTSGPVLVVPSSAIIDSGTQQVALVELMAEKKFDAISVQDIAERATVNRTTFYDHFADKYELFARYSREWFRQSLQQRLAADATFSRANLELLILASMQAAGSVLWHWALAADGLARVIERL